MNVKRDRSRHFNCQANCDFAVVKFNRPERKNPITFDSCAGKSDA